VYWVSLSAIQRLHQWLGFTSVQMICVETSVFKMVTHIQFEGLAAIPFQHTTNWAKPPPTPSHVLSYLLAAFKNPPAIVQELAKTIFVVTPMWHREVSTGPAPNVHGLSCTMYNARTRSCRHRFSAPSLSDLLRSRQSQRKYVVRERWCTKRARPAFPCRWCMQLHRPPPKHFIHTSAKTNASTEDGLYGCCTYSS
jgi:hypothetical protein